MAKRRRRGPASARYESMGKGMPTWLIVGMPLAAVVGLVVFMAQQKEQRRRALKAWEIQSSRATSEALMPYSERLKADPVFAEREARRVHSEIEAERRALADRDWASWIRPQILEKREQFRKTGEVPGDLEDWLRKTAEHPSAIRGAGNVRVLINSFLVELGRPRLTPLVIDEQN